MHFFYLDESGCTGKDLKSKQQPILVPGGIAAFIEQESKGLLEEIVGEAE